jgi:hypothetical protein
MHRVITRSPGQTAAAQSVRRSGASWGMQAYAVVLRHAIQASQVIWNLTL